MSDPRDSGAATWQPPEFTTPGRAAQNARMNVSQLESLEAQARDEGLARGLAEGRLLAQSELRRKAAFFDTLCAALAQPMRDVDAQIEEDLTQLALSVARQLIRRELRTAPGEVMAAMRAALAALPAHSREVRVRVHPEDAALIREHIGDEQRERAWKLVEDIGISRGGCIVESNHSRVDASVEARLQRVVGEVLGGTRTDDAGQGDAT